MRDYPGRLTTLAQRPGHEGVRLQPGREGRVRCSAWLGGWIVVKPFTMLPKKPVQFVFVSEIPNQAAIATGKALFGQRGTAGDRECEKPQAVRPKHGCGVTEKSSGYDAPTTALGTRLHKPPNGRTERCGRPSASKFATKVARPHSLQ